MPVTLWRCRDCGKWSTAKRDPIRHKRWHAHDHDEDGRCASGWFVWCGPFDRWTAVLDDPAPREAWPQLGDPVRPGEMAEAKDESPWRPLSEGEIPF